MSTNFKAANSYTGSVDGAGMKVAIVCGRFNDLITNRLLDGALAGLAIHGVREDDVAVAWVPGAFEIPLAAKTFALTGRYDAVVALGAVIRGDTAHFEYVAGPCAEGLQQAQLETGVPILPVVVAGTRHAIPKNSWIFGVKCQARIEVLPPVEVKGLTMDDLDALRDRVRGDISAAFERLGKWMPTLPTEEGPESSDAPAAQAAIAPPPA